MKALAFFLLFNTYSFISASDDTLSPEQRMPIDDHNRLFRSKDDFPVDESGTHLAHNWLVYTNTDKCRNDIRRTWDNPQHDHFLRALTAADNSLSDLLFTSKGGSLNSHDDYESCVAVCLERGTRIDMIQYYLPEAIHSWGKKDSSLPAEEGGGDLTHIEDWVRESCQMVEFGIINYEQNEATVYWINEHSGERVDVGHLGIGERQTFWQTTHLGHRFEVESIHGEYYGSLTIEGNSFNVIGNAGSRVMSRNVTREVKGTLDAEYQRAYQVRRTFTEVGFNKGRMPEDLWTSMQTYYYNNRFNTVREEWDYKGLYVNWWERDAYMIGMPWGLKKYWQTRLLPLVEAWAGVELELTDMYGLRQYEDGARLLTHVDREETHAASLIINIAQEAIREPWKVEIYDFANRLHEITMDAGDIVYYESARCLHGRMKPLEGAFYVNLFVHYRPIGDPQWFRKSNPAGAIPPLIDISQLPVSHPSLKFLNKNETIKNGDDLFEWWQRTAPEEPLVLPDVVYSPEEFPDYNEGEAEGDGEDFYHGDGDADADEEEYGEEHEHLHEDDEDDGYDNEREEL